LRKQIQDYVDWPFEDGRSECARRARDLQSECRERSK
jgi:hypothetical protein